MGEGLTMTNLLDPRSRPQWAPPSGPPPGGTPAPRPPEPRRTPAGVRFLWKLFAALLVIGVLVWGPYQVVTLLAHDERVETATFPAAGLTTVAVDGTSGSVTIEAADTATIRVRAEISDGLRKTGETREVVGDTLRLHSTCPNFGSDWCHVNYEITIPRDLAVVISNDDGHVSVAGTTKAVDINGDNGSVDLADLSGPLHVSTDNGRVTAVRLQSPTVTADTDNGRLSLEFAAAPTTVVATADNGRIDLVVPADRTAYRVAAATDNGSKDITVPEDPASDRTITARADNGSISIRTATS
jgi:Toastrack DUF4097